jgi:peptidoglycan/xylan/chitin deacetylase (PgdA/CDA1 family)
MGIKGIVLEALPVARLTTFFARLLRHRATILTLHRFRDPDLAVEGMDPRALDAGLAYLRRHRYELLGVEELFRRMAGGGPPLRGAVAFTLDDGYLEQATVAAPVFARYDCPATTFVITGFLDGALWPWWDRIEHVFRETPRRQLNARLAGAAVQYAWTDDDGRRSAQADFVERCKRVPDATKETAIAALACAADVEIPVTPPPRYRPMSWSQLRQCEGRGMRFGPHTVTHPVLSRTGDEQSRREVTDSWARVRAEARDPVPVFCYPNGGREDCGPRERAVVAEQGFLGALLSVGEYVDARVLRRNASARLQVPRFGYPDDLPHLVQIVAGVERAKRIVRRQVVA